MSSKEFSSREKEIIQYGLSLLYDMIETCRIMEIPEIEGVPLPTLEEVRYAHAGYVNRVEKG